MFNRNVNPRQFDLPSVPFDEVGEHLRAKRKELE